VNSTLKFKHECYRLYFIILDRSDLSYNLLMLRVFCTKCWARLGIWASSYSTLSRTVGVLFFFKRLEFNLDFIVRFGFCLEPFIIIAQKYMFFYLKKIIIN
jgi:hypothetical protein